MSIVTSIILTVHCAEDGFDVEHGETAKIDRINKFLDGYGKSNLHFLTLHMCNGKHPQTLTFGGGYNCFPDDEFIEFIGNMEWKNPENVVLVLQPEEGDTIVWRPKF